MLFWPLKIILEKVEASKIFEWIDDSECYTRTRFYSSFAIAMDIAFVLAV